MNQLDHARFLLEQGLIGSAYRKLLIECIKRLEAKYDNKRNL